METALQVLAAFILVDLLAALLLIGLVGLLRFRQAPNERISFGPLLGALIFLVIISGLIYGGIWMCLRAAS